MSKAKHECAVCGETFAKIFDHMSHYMKNHDEGYKPRGERRFRKVSCWGCGTGEMAVPNFDAGEWWRCECGYELPRNWVNGQLLPEN